MNIEKEYFEMDKRLSEMEKRHKKELLIFGMAYCLIVLSLFCTLYNLIYGD